MLAYRNGKDSAALSQPLPFSEVNIDALRFVLSLDALPQKLDEIVRLSSNAARQQTEESTVNDFYSVSGFQDFSAFNCELFQSLSAERAV